MDLDLAGKTALVCGSSQGIGLAAAQSIAKLGASVVLLARDADRLQQAAQTLHRGPGAQHSTVTADFADSTQVADAARAITGRGAVHILVNNTGGPSPGPAAEATAQALADAFRAHVVANHALAQACIPGMKLARFGRIINVISTSVKQPIPNLGVSNTVRAAVANWAKTLAGELGPFGITVNNLLPGFTDTARLGALFQANAARRSVPVDVIRREAIESIPARRLGRPQELGDAIAFLASPAAAYINGINLPVDGGRLACL